MSFEPRTLARMATAIENRERHALDILDSLEPGHARIIGITGPPGAGKSTLVGALARTLRQQGKTVAILAVDPSSRLTGGALLGDRIRMQDHHADPGVFIRSMATRGNPGGVARATADMIRLMASSGKDYVIVETVGVGQDEIEIASLAQVTVVVPGMGDDVQAIKAGILEIASVFAINKADQPGADRVEHELQAMLSLTGGPKPPIVRTVATGGTGVEELLDAIEQAPRQPLPHSRGCVPCRDAEQAIALRVPDLADAVERLRAAGARLLNEPRPNAGGQLSVFVHLASTGGVLLELIQEGQT